MGKAVGKPTQVIGMGKRKTKKSGPRAAEHEERRLLEMLRAALSEDELRRVLACALLSFDDSGRERLPARLGPSTGDTVREVLSAHASDGSAKSPAPGARKGPRELGCALGPLARAVR